MSARLRLMRFNMTPRLDAHQHFWRYDAVQYPWIPVGSPLERDWLPIDLQSVQTPQALDGSIVVQARQSLAESDWLWDSPMRTRGFTASSVGSISVRRR